MIEASNTSTSTRLKCGLFCFGKVFLCPSVPRITPAHRADGLPPSAVNRGAASPQPRLRQRVVCRQRQLCQAAAKGLAAVKECMEFRAAELKVGAHAERLP